MNKWLKHFKENNSGIPNRRTDSIDILSSKESGVSAQKISCIEKDRETGIKNKWLSKLKNKKSNTPIASTDNVDTLGTTSTLSVDSLGLLQGISFLQPKSEELYFAGILSEEIPVEDFLSSEKQAYKGWYDVLTGPNHRMPPKEGHRRALSLLQTSLRTRQANKIKTDFRLDGFVKIWSSYLKQFIYLVRDERKARFVPDKTIPVFTADEIRDFSTLSREDALLLVEAKAIFNPRGFFQDE